MPDRLHDKSVHYVHWDESKALKCYQRTRNHKIWYNRFKREPNVHNRTKKYKWMNKFNIRLGRVEENH